MNSHQDKYNSHDNILARKFVFVVLLILLFIGGSSLCLIHNKDNAPQSHDYKLIFFDDFNGKSIDTTSWSKMERNRLAYGKYMSSNNKLYKVKNGYLRLYGRYNNIQKSDTAEYLTGGVTTKGKRSINFGKVEVKARMHGAVASWPAIWLFRTEPDKVWPSPEYAEIDLMEYLNNEDYVMQTVHSYYTMHLNKKKEPNHQARPKVKAEEWNVYSVEVLPDVIIFSINGEETFRYPKIKTSDTGQFPYGQNSYLMIDMQIGASWLPKPDKSTFPSYIDVDWVKMYDLTE